MKKLMTAAIVAFAAIGLNAATVTWGAAKGYLYNGTAAEKITSGSAYLMYVTSTYTQSDLVTAFKNANGKADATLTAMSDSGALATGAGEIGANARISGTSTSTLAGADGTAYFVVFANDMMYVSNTADSVYDSVSGEASATFLTSMTSSSKLEFQAANGYSDAGWYKAVPEPTSGLLMLLGIAGLALKRRRA